MASTRLPGKVAMEVNERHTLLSMLRDRIVDAQHDSIWLATTESELDDPLRKLAKAWGWKCFSGSEKDVLSRFTEIGRIERADWIVRVTADNPLTHYEGINHLIDQAREVEDSVSYISDFVLKELPIGFLPEAVRFNTLLEISKIDLPMYHRTHVTSFIVEKNLGCMPFRSKPYFPPRPYWRWTIDELSDLEFLRSLSFSAASEIEKYNYRQLIEHIDRNNWLLEINKNVRTKPLNEG